MTDEYQAFALQTLVPKAHDILLDFFTAHKNGDDIDIADKADGTPASMADRETEQALRALIRKAYPDHGVIGEEFGAEKTGAEFVWILDLLDGTREFLAKDTGWGSLIGLMQNGRPVLGIIHAPLEERTWCFDAAPDVPAKPLSEAVAGCTSYSMFEGTDIEQGAARLFENCASVRDKLNCLGAAYVADGRLDVFCENQLKIYDVVPLLPVLWNAGATCCMLDGRDYRDFTFNPGVNDNYGLLAARDEKLVREALAVMGTA